MRIGKLGIVVQDNDSRESYEWGDAWWITLSWYTPYYEKRLDVYYLRRGQKHTSEPFAWRDGWMGSIGRLGWERITIYTKKGHGLFSARKQLSDAVEWSDWKDWG